MEATKAKDVSPAESRPVWWWPAEVVQERVTSGSLKQPCCWAMPLPAASSWKLELGLPLLKRRHQKPPRSTPAPTCACSLPRTTVALAMWSASPLTPSELWLLQPRMRPETTSTVGSSTPQLAA